MSRSAEIIQAALSWVGTPYHHQARVKGVGVDCAQLIAGIAEDVGIIEPGTHIPFDYSREWHLHSRESLLVRNLEHFGCVKKDKAEPGDILCFQYGRCISHLGILVPGNRVVHAATYLGKVVLNTLGEELLRRHRQTYSYP